MNDFALQRTRRRGILTNLSNTALALRYARVPGESRVPVAGKGV